MILLCQSEDVVQSETVNMSTFGEKPWRKINEN